MNASIEELLRSVESDDDNDSSGGAGDLDLESLLRGDDDDDDDLPVSSYSSANYGNQKLSAPKVNIFQTRPVVSAVDSKIEVPSVAHPSQNGDSDSEAASPKSRKHEEIDASPIGDILRDIEDRGVQSSLARIFNSNTRIDELDETQAPTNSDATSNLDPTANDSMALDQAEIREQRLLSAPDKVGMSALQIRRANSAGVLSNMTSVEEVAEITKQLLRNGSYEQHGPGTATAMAICNKFVAVGTTKGVIILFDHKQEIRRVLSLQQNTNASSVGGAAMTMTSAALSSFTSATSANSSNANALNNKQLHVTALDCLSDGSAVLSGHRSCDIFLWDTVRGTVIRQMRDPSNSEIVSLGFVPSIALPDVRINATLTESDAFHFVTWSSSHVLNRFKLSRSLLTAWHQEVDCLLDERSGVVLSMSILKPCAADDTAASVHADDADNHYTSSTTARRRGSSTSESNKEYVDIKQLGMSLQFFAFGFAHQTCVVQVSPTVKILHKWKTNAAVNGNNNNYSTASSNSSAGTNSSKPREVLDWSWLPLPITPANTTTNDHHTATSVLGDGTSILPPVEDEDEVRRRNKIAFLPVLTRCRGRFIEVLAMRATRTYPTPATVSPAVSSPFAATSSILQNTGSAGASTTTPETATTNTTLNALRRSSLSLFGGFMSGVSAAANATNSMNNSNNNNNASSSSYGGNAHEEIDTQPVIGFEFHLVSSCLVKLSEEEAAEYAAHQQQQQQQQAQVEGSAQTPSASTTTSELDIVDVKWINSSQLIALTKREALLFDLNLVCLERVALPKGLSENIAWSLSVANLQPSNAGANSNASSSGAGNAGGSTLCTRAYAQQVYALQSRALHRVVVKSALDQVHSLVTSGRWLEGLARLVDAVSKSPPLLQTEAENIKRFILNYALLAVKRSSSSSSHGSMGSPLLENHNNSFLRRGSQLGGGGGGVSGTPATDHFALVASVCVEYCVATRLLPVLFHEILDIFRSEQQQAALLEALEPWILAQQTIIQLPARVIAEFLENAALEERFRSIERCVPHFDPHSLDLNFVSRFLFRHRMFSSFLYVYAHGVGDFPGAFSMVFEHIAHQQHASSSLGQALVSAALNSQHAWQLFVQTQAETVYKLLLFVRCVFKGRVFPRATTPAVYSIATMWSLLALLVQDEWRAQQNALFSTSSATSSKGGQAGEATAEAALLQSSYPVLRLCLAVDKGAVFTVLREGLSALQSVVLKVNATSSDSATTSDASRLGTASTAAKATPTSATASRGVLVDENVDSDEEDGVVDEVADEDEEEEDNEATSGSRAKRSAAAGTKPSADKKVLHVLHQLFRCCRLRDREEELAREGEEGERADAAMESHTFEDDEDDEGVSEGQKNARKAHGQRLAKGVDEDFMGDLEADFFDRFHLTLCALSSASLLSTKDLLLRLLHYAHTTRGLNHQVQLQQQLQQQLQGQVPHQTQQSSQAQSPQRRFEGMFSRLARRQSRFILRYGKEDSASILGDTHVDLEVIDLSHGSDDARIGYLQQLQEALRQAGFYVASLAVSFPANYHHSVHKQQLPSPPSIDLATPVRHYLHIAHYYESTETSNSSTSNTNNPPLAFQYLDTLLQQLSGQKIKPAHKQRHATNFTFSYNNNFGFNPAQDSFGGNSGSNNAYSHYHAPSALYMAAQQQLLPLLVSLYRAEPTYTARICAQHLLEHLNDIVCRHSLPSANTTQNITSTAAEDELSSALTVEESETLRLAFLQALLKEFRALYQRATLGSNSGNNGSGMDTNSGSNNYIAASGHLQEPALLVYVQLLAKYAPDALVPFLRDFQLYVGLDACLEIARQCGVYDAVAYLLERAGDVTGALQVLLQDISRKIRQARRDLDSHLRWEHQQFLKGSNGLGGSNSNTSGANARFSQLMVSTASLGQGNGLGGVQGGNLETWMQRLPVCRRLQALVDAVVHLCERQQQQGQLSLPLPSPHNTNTGRRTCHLRSFRFAL